MSGNKTNIGKMRVADLPKIFGEYCYVRKFNPTKLGKSRGYFLYIGKSAVLIPDDKDVMEFCEIFGAGGDPANLDDVKTVVEKKPEKQIDLGEITNIIKPEEADSWIL